MTTGEAIRAVLVADAAVAALVGADVFPALMPQGTQPPAIVYSVISSVPENSLTGTASTRLSQFRVQVDCYAKTYLEAHAVAEAVDSVLDAQSSPNLSIWRESSRDDYDNEAELHRVSMDFGVWR